MELMLRNAVDATARRIEFFGPTTREQDMAYIQVIQGAQHVRALLRLQQVLALTGLARSTLYKLVSERSFPAPIPLTGRAVAWDSQAVDAWIESRITAAN